MVVNNARPIQRILVFGTGGAFTLMFILAFYYGELYRTQKETIIGISFILALLFLTFLVYFLLIKFADSSFIFNERGFIRKFRKKVILEVAWEDVISIGCFRIYDFLKIDIGPNFLGVEYWDKNHIKQEIQVAFPLKDAKKLRDSLLNSKLKYLV